MIILIALMLLTVGEVLISTIKMENYKEILEKTEKYINGDFSLDKESDKYHALRSELGEYVDEHNIKVVLTVDGAIKVLKMFIDDKISLEQLHRWAMFKLESWYIDSEDGSEGDDRDKFKDDVIPDLILRLDWIGEEHLVGEFTKKEAKVYIDRLIKSKKLLEKLKKSDQK